MPLLFSKIWRPLCSLTQHGCFLFFKFTLASGVFACVGVERERYSKISEREVDICEEKSENIQKYLHGWYPARTEANHQMLEGVFIRGSRINEIGGNVRVIGVCQVIKRNTPPSRLPDFNSLGCSSCIFIYK